MIVNDVWLKILKREDKIEDDMIEEKLLRWWKDYSKDQKGINK